MSNTKTIAKQRPPIIVIMGHVDHGKTTLLDYIRKANVAAREAGGITQAVGAYEIEHKAAGAGPEPARKMTFIDTPGHEAFTAMRSRGALIADIAILVIAADEGVKPQTKEAITIIQEAKIPFVVAINKIDKTNGDLDKARNELMTAGVLLEGYGGQTSYHGISAKTGAGVDDLLDLILLTADVENLTYDPSAPASGYVLEASRDPRRGIEATLVIKEGTLKRGDLITTGTASGKVKILENFLEKTVNELEPSAPAVVIGFENLPQVGETFVVGAAQSSGVAESTRTKPPQKIPNGPVVLNLILKASDGGSLEALSAVLKSVDQKEKNHIAVIEQSVGDITDGDVKHAMATGSTIIGFKSRVEKGAKVLGEAQSILIITSEIVYDLAKAVEDFLTGKRGPAAAGELEVLAIFNQEKPEKQLVGGKVTKGNFRPKASFDLLREGTHAPIATGKVLGLREKKNEITQAELGKEIGVLVNCSALIQVGDRLVIRK